METQQCQEQLEEFSSLSLETQKAIIKVAVDRSIVAHQAQNLSLYTSNPLQDADPTSLALAESSWNPATIGFLTSINQTILSEMYIFLSIDSLIGFATGFKRVKKICRLAYVKPL